MLRESSHFDEGSSLFSDLGGKVHTTCSNLFFTGYVGVFQTKDEPSTLSGTNLIRSYHFWNYHIISTCSGFQMFLTGRFPGGVTDLFPEHVCLLDLRMSGHSYHLWSWWPNRCSLPERQEHWKMSANIWNKKDLKHALEHVKIYTELRIYSDLLYWLLTNMAKHSTRSKTHVPRYLETFKQLHQQV